MTTEIDLSDLLDEVEPVTVLKLGKEDSYSVYRTEDMSVEDMIRVNDIGVRFMEVSQEFNAKMEQLRAEALALDPDNEAGIKRLEMQKNSAEMHLLPLMSEFVETVSGMPKGRLKRLSVKRISTLFQAISKALNPNPPEDAQDVGKQEPTITTSS